MDRSEEDLMIDGVFNDYYGVIVQDKTEEAFVRGLELITYRASAGRSDRKVLMCNGYSIKDNKLYLSNYAREYVSFPYNFNLEQATAFAWGWWKANQIPSYEEPDTDGHTEVGWRLTDSGIYTWGMFASVEPVWLVFGK